MTDEQPSYVYIWEFIVKSDSLVLFEKAYGVHGTWVQLFRKGKGYLKTELYHDRDNHNRYLTIDYWASKETFELFRSAYSTEFEKLDNECASFTERETLLGTFFLSQS